jgi:hypothetical protein
MKTDEILAGLRQRFNEKGMTCYSRIPEIRQYLLADQT